MRNAFNMSFDLNLYSQYRTELMGWAIIMVVISHIHGFGVSMYEPLRQLTSVGASGVELFLFVSGFGLWKSLRTATNGTFSLNASVLVPWYKRRYYRILVPYVIFAIPMYGVLTIMDQQDFGEFVRRVTFLSFWTKGWGLWYVAMLIPLYFISPFIIKLLSGKGKIICFVVSLLAAEFFAYFAFGGKRDVYYSRFIVQRLPSFFIGIFMAESICDGKKISLWIVLFVPLLAYFMLRGLNHTIGTRFFYLWLLPLPFSTITSWLVTRYSWLRTTLNFMGVLSLELYCTHMFLPKLLIRVFNISPSIYMYLVGVGACIIVSAGINMASNILISKLSDK